MDDQIWFVFGTEGDNVHHTRRLPHVVHAKFLDNPLTVAFCDLSASNESIMVVIQIQGAFFFGDGHPGEGPLQEVPSCFEAGN